MESLIYDALAAIYTGGVITETTQFLADIMKALVTLFKDPTFSEKTMIFASMSGALMIIFFYMDLASQASRDIITLEKLVTSCIKFFIAFMILLYLQEIITALFNLCYLIYQSAAASLKETMNKDMIFFPGYYETVTFKPTPGALPPKSDALMDYIKNQLGYKNAITGYAKNMDLFLALIIPYFLATGAKYVSFFISVSNALMLIVQAIFAPLGVVQLFDEGQRSTGVRYLKRFAATGLTFAIILGILYGSTKFQTILISIQTNKLTSIDISNLKTAFSGTVGIQMVIIQFGCVGLLFKALQIAKETVGV